MLHWCVDWCWQWMVLFAIEVKREIKGVAFLDEKKLGSIQSENGWIDPNKMVEFGRRSDFVAKERRLVPLASYLFNSNQSWVSGVLENT